MAEIVDKIILEDAEYLKALKKIDRGIDNLSKSAQQGFNKVDRTVKSSGLQIRAISGVVSAVTTEFINLAKQAVNTFVEIGKQSVEAALEVDTLRARLLGIFDGSQDAANEAFDFIQKRSRDLGVDLGELAGAFLPETESLEQFERIAKLATALARSDPGQGAVGARIALTEALSGSFTTLQRRFEVTDADLAKIENAFNEEGIEGFIDALETSLQRAGKDFDTLGGTASATFDRVGVRFQQIFQDIGGPALESIQRQLDNLGSLLDERGDDLELIAGAVGDVIANIADFVGSVGGDFLANIDAEQVIEIANNFNDLVEDARVFAEILELTELPQDLLDGVQTVTEKLGEAFDTAIKISAINRAETARTEAEQQVVLEQVKKEGGGRVAQALVGTPGVLPVAEAISPILGDEQTEATFAEARAAGERAYQEELLRSVEILEQSDERQQDLLDKQEERAQKQQEIAQTGAADEVLQMAQAEAAAAEEAAAFGEALAELQEKLVKLDTQKERAQIDALIDKVRDLADEEIKTAQQREKAERDFQRKIDELRLEATDERAKKELEIESETAEKRADSERDFRREIEDIQRESNLRLLDAERSRDAVAFLQALENQQEEIQQAKTDRDRKQEEIEIDRQRREEELGEVESDLEERIAKERRALEARKEDINIASEERRAQREVEFERELSDIDLQNRRKLNDLQQAQAAQIETIEQGLGREVNLVKDTEQLKTAIIEEEVEKRLELLRAEIELREELASVSPGGSVGLGSNPSLLTFQRGGVVPGSPGTPVPIIAHAGETIIPANPQMTTPGLGPQSSVTNNIDNSRSASLGGLLDPGSLDSILNARVENILVRLLGSI